SLLRPRPPRPPLFPSTTLFRSSTASAGAIRSAFVAMTVLTVLSLPFLMRLARFSGMKPAASFPLRELLHIDLARFGRILLPTLILGIGAGMYLNFIQLYLLQRFVL